LSKNAGSGSVLNQSGSTTLLKIPFNTSVPVPIPGKNRYCYGHAITDFQTANQGGGNSLRKKHLAELVLFLSYRNLPLFSNENLHFDLYNKENFFHIYRYKNISIAIYCTTSTGICNTDIAQIKEQKT
jgi:hypothetical protein